MTEIRDGAFSGCPDAFIEVEDSNEFYRSCDGALFDKAGKILFCGQSLILNDGSCTIPDSIEEIGAFAFSRCTSLKEVVIPATCSIL